MSPSFFNPTETRGETKRMDEDIINSQDKLYKYALYLTNDTKKAKDLTQDTTLKALEKRNKFKEDTNIVAWLKTIMRNIFITGYHEDKKEMEHVSRIDSTTYNQPAEESSFLDNVDFGIIKKTINSLADRKREIFRLYVAQYTYVEISEKLNIPIGTLKREIHEIRQELRCKLKELKD